MPRPFHYDLGDFDPIFPGITLHFPNEAIWKYTETVAAIIYSFGVQDTLHRDSNLTTADITAALMMEQLLQNPDRGFTLTAEEKDRLGLSLIANALDDAVGYLAAGSAHEHELRHFHDWLLSPYAAAINAMRMEVNLNYAQLRPFIYGSGATVIPVPLPRWLRKTASEQAELIRMWQDLLGDTVQCAFLTSRRRMCCRRSSRSNAATNRFGAFFSPWADCPVVMPLPCSKQAQF